MLPMTRLAALITVSTISLYAQDALRGHWSGGEHIPGREPITVEVDFDKVPEGWIGSLSIPAQNVTGIPLEAITYAKDRCSFRIKGMPDDPTYTGTLSQDGKVIEGDYTEGTLKVPFKFTRTGEPKVEIPQISPRVSQEFVGTWEGTLQLGQGRKAQLRISNDERGSHAVLISVDEGNGQIPATSLDQQGSVLTVALTAFGGARYVAQINKEGTELRGTLSLDSNEIPFDLKKLPPENQKGGPKPQQWEEYAYPNDGFAITLPERAQPHEDRTLSVATFKAFTVTTPYAYTVHLSQDLVLTLHVVTFPKGCANFFNQYRDMIRSAKRGTLDTDKMGIRLEPSEADGETEAGGYAALEAERDNGSKDHSYDRTQCVEKKLYVFSTVWPIGSKMPPEIGRIIASFRVLKQ
jgi:hypothetical protein